MTRGDLARRGPLAVLAAALIVGSLPRIDAVARFYPPETDQRTDARRYYISMAESALAGKGWIPSYPTNFIPPPGQAAFIYVFKALWPRSDFQHLRSVQAVVSILTIVFAFLIGRALRDPWTGAVAASLVALDYRQSRLVGVLVPETNDLFFLFASVAALGAALARPTASRAAAAGALLAVACLFKPTPLLLGPVAALVLWRRAAQWRPALGFAAGFLLVLAPWMVRNRVHYGEWYPISTNGGTLLALANAPALDAAREDMVYWDDLYRRDYYRDPEIEARYAGRIDGDGKPEENLKDRAYLRKALGYMAKQPLHFARNYVYKLSNFVLYPPPEPSTAPFPFRELGGLGALITAAGLAGAVLLVLRRRHDGHAQAVLLTTGYLLAFGALLHLTRDGRMNVAFRALVSVPAAYLLVTAVQAGVRAARARGQERGGEGDDGHDGPLEAKARV